MFKSVMILKVRMRLRNYREDWIDHISDLDPFMIRGNVWTTGEACMGPMDQIIVMYQFEFQ